MIWTPTPDYATPQTLSDNATHQTLSDNATPHNTPAYATPYTTSDIATPHTTPDYSVPHTTPTMLPLILPSTMLQLIQPLMILPTILPLILPSTMLLLILPPPMPPLILPPTMLPLILPPTMLLLILPPTMLPVILPPCTGGGNRQLTLAETREIQTKYPNTNRKQQLFDKNVLRLYAIDGCALSTVHGHVFKALIEGLDPRITIKTRQTYSEQLKKAVNIEIIPPLGKSDVVVSDNADMKNCFNLLNIDMDNELRTLLKEKTKMLTPAAIRRELNIPAIVTLRVTTTSTMRVKTLLHV
ncbi:unnamed protein product [Orchesella dallaii]|uniref:Uncharacterized protein n=1 Tax=Orchesella dallaii TaxID=48710 RepID=A0ABP1SAF2_9HEXA